MNYTRNAPELSCSPIVNFRFFDQATMQLLARDLRLSLSTSALFHLQHAFCTREQRDPTVGELVLCNAFACLWHGMPGATTIFRIEGTGEGMRAIRDLFRKHASLCDQAPPTLPEAMDILPRYLARSGIYPRERGLYCGAIEEMETLSALHGSLLSLQLPHTAAHVLKEEHEPKRPLPAGALLLLSPTGKRPFAEEIRDLLDAPGFEAVTPLATPMQEGLFPHLLSLGGVVLNADALPDYAADAVPADLVRVGRDTLLLHAPHHLTPALLSTAPNLSLIGSTVPTGRLQLYRGMQTLLTLPMQILASLRATHTPLLTLPAAGAATPPVCKAVIKNGRALFGIEITGDAETALFAFLRDAAGRADLSRATLTAVLSLPEGKGVENALPLLFGYHRAAAELSLPAIHHRQMLSKADTPVLGVYLTAPALQKEEMLDAPDFAALRARIYNK